MRIAQLSDLHVLPDAALWRDRIDVQGNLRAAIARLNALRPGIDGVVITGDLAHHGRPDTYRQLRTLLAELAMPYWLLPGNHDDPAALRAIFPEQSFTPGSVCGQAVRLPEGDLLLLDCAVPNASHGVFGPQQLAWLEAHLRPDIPALLFMHFPPFATGIGGMDGIRLRNPELLAAWLRQHLAVQGVYCGHVHRAVFTQWAGLPVAIAPSTAHQMALDLDPAAALRYTPEPPGMLVIEWHGESPITHMLPVFLCPVYDYN